MRNRRFSLRRVIKLIVCIVSALFLLFIISYTWFTCQIMEEGYYAFFEIEEA